MKTLRSCQRELVQQFNRRDFFPGKEEYHQTLALILAQGKNELEELIGVLGKPWLRATLKASGWQEEDLQRILGYGATFTGYLVAPAQPEADKTPALKHCGAIANLIVSLYDELVDLGHDPEVVFSESKLYRLIYADEPRPDRPSNNHQPVPALVEYYFHQLLSHPVDEDRKPVMARLLMAIKDMYKSENRTLQNKEVQAQDLLNKSRLPFVVMGLPAWLFTPSLDQKAYSDHFDWLMAIGEFIGWLDDAVDLDSDQATGHPNLVAMASLRGENIEQIIHRIPLQYEQAQDFWTSHVEEADQLPLEDRESFRIMTCAWLGGPPLVKKKSTSSTLVR